MQYTGFEMREIISNCDTPDQLQMVGNIVWEDSKSHLPMHEMAWFAYSLNKRLVEIRRHGE